MSRGRELRPAADTLDQGSSQRLLQQSEATADGGLRSVQPSAGPREAAELGNRDKGFDFLEVHWISIPDPTGRDYAFYK